MSFVKEEEEKLEKVLAEVNSLIEKSRENIELGVLLAEINKIIDLSLQETSECSENIHLEVNDEATREEISEAEHRDLIQLMCLESTNKSKEEIVSNQRSEDGTSNKVVNYIDEQIDIVDTTEEDIKDIFAPAINLSTTLWRISKPIFICPRSFPDLQIYAKEILLAKGFFKIEYTLIGLKKGGLGVFDLNQKLKQLLTYVGPQGVIYQEGHKYINLEESSFISITNDKGEPESKGTPIVAVTILKKKDTPN